jgi:hypothetical protein
MQSSGICDINHKEAYLHDIVKIEGYGVGKVVFQGGCFMIEWGGDVYNEPLFGKNFRKRDFEIIGNIFDNPEMNEEKQNEQ